MHQNEFHCKSFCINLTVTSGLIMINHHLWFFILFLFYEIKMTIDIALLGMVRFPAGFSSWYFMFGLQVVFYAVDLIPVKEMVASRRGQACHPVPCKPVCPMQIQYRKRLRPELRPPFKAQQSEFGINRYEFAKTTKDQYSLNFKKIYFKHWFDEFEWGE